MSTPTFTSPTVLLPCSGYQNLRSNTSLAGRRPWRAGHAPTDVHLDIRQTERAGSLLVGRYIENKPALVTGPPSAPNV